MWISCWFSLCFGYTSEWLCLLVAMLFILVNVLYWINLLPWPPWTLLLDKWFRFDTLLSVKLLHYQKKVSYLGYAVKRLTILSDWYEWCDVHRGWLWRDVAFIRQHGPLYGHFYSYQWACVLINVKQDIFFTICVCAFLTWFWAEPFWLWSCLLVWYTWVYCCMFQKEISVI